MIVTKEQLEAISKANVIFAEAAVASVKMISDGVNWHIEVPPGQEWERGEMIMARDQINYYGTHREEKPPMKTYQVEELKKELPELGEKLNEVQRLQNEAVNACERRWTSVSGRAECGVRVRFGYEMNAEKPYASFFTRIDNDKTLDSNDYEFLLERRRAFERWCRNELKSLPPSEVWS